MEAQLKPTLFKNDLPHHGILYMVNRPYLTFFAEKFEFKIFVDVSTYGCL